METGYRVYWAPGCTSCLRTKEFLLSHNIAFESINIVEQPEAMQDLASIGFRSVPVVRRGDEGVFCQDLNDVADFIGVTLPQSTLSFEDYINKLDGILQASQRFVRQLSDEQLANNFPGRDRPFRDLAYHIFIVGRGFLDAAEGGCLEVESFLLTPPQGMVSGEAIAAFGETIRSHLIRWWQQHQQALPTTVNTYYGERTTISVLERATWHAAQHCRQLQAIVEMNDIAPNQPLSDKELGGLPLPESIYDNEIAIDDDSIETKPLPKPVA